MVTKSLSLLTVLFVTVSACFGNTTFNGREYTQFTQTGDQWFEVYQADTFRVVGTDIFVKFTSTTTETQINNLNSLLGGETVHIYLDSLHLIPSTASTPPDPLEFMASYLDASMVVEGSNNTCIHYCQPNDPEYANLNATCLQRFLRQPEGEIDNTINPLPAWAITKGSPNVKVGILDGGFLYKHTDLHKNIWQNPGEDINQDGIWELVDGVWEFDHTDLNDVDDDGNGIVDDLIGIAFDENLDTSPNLGQTGAFANMNGHGTLLAGVIGADTNNELQFAGISGGWGESKVFRSCSAKWLIFLLITLGLKIKPL